MEILKKAVIAFKMWGLLKYIDVVAASAELGVAKPDREISKKHLKWTGVRRRKRLSYGL